MQLPDEVRGLYLTVNSAGSAWGPELLDDMVARGLNTVVMDVKDDQGVVNFPPTDFIRALAQKGIYKIARIAVMRDAAFAAAHEDVVLKTRGGKLWRDNTGSVWLDPAASAVADEAVATGTRAHVAGFDEVQFDYVRFPSDGEVLSIVYPVFDETKTTKIEVMQKFFERVGGAMQEAKIPVSFDLFGMTFWSRDDFNIGQRMQDALAHADFVSPMAYPSHYPDGFEGYANPAEHPYEIVKRTLDEGAKLMGDVNPPPFEGGDRGGSEAKSVRIKFRPWLQDFDIGAVYTAAMIEAQIKAARDAGASGWMLWNARNVYEPANYLLE